MHEDHFEHHLVGNWWPFPRTGLLSPRHPGLHPRRDDSCRCSLDAYGEFRPVAFGRSVIQPVKGTGGMSRFSNAVWFLVAGLWLAIGHVTTAAAQAVTIVGIPVALANLKMIPVTCFPFGRKIVDSDHIPFGWESMIKL